MGILQHIYDRIGRKVEKLAGQAVSRGITLDYPGQPLAEGEPELRPAPGLQRGAGLPVEPGVRGGDPPAAGLPGAVPAGRAALDLPRDPPAPGPAAIQPRRPRRLLPSDQELSGRAGGHRAGARLRGTRLRRSRPADAGRHRPGLAGSEHPDVHRGGQPAGARAVRQGARAVWARRSAAPIGSR